MVEIIIFLFFLSVIDNVSSPTEEIIKKGSNAIIPTDVVKFFIISSFISLSLNLWMFFFQIWKFYFDLMIDFINVSSLSF